MEMVGMGSFGRGKRGGDGGLGGFDWADKRFVFVVMAVEAAALVGSILRRRERSVAAAVVPPSGFAREQRAMSNAGPVLALGDAQGPIPIYILARAVCAASRRAALC